ncbi:MAG: ABC transporter ATP-binding protein [Actinomyces sp.]|uniref:ABC transporter ATP-binding protein n=1 Tax=Actinomyces sp. TaxID=29317 RepID=UPI0026DB6C8E|nr:ABC transporter ATP-binding protein [Actinomyces sp.]MDO4243072.1 ABC transporter ATP-binding protein [Actinomyces sp.]
MSTRDESVPSNEPARTTAGARATVPSRRTLVAWLLSVTRPVLPPLLGSAACRVLDHLAGVGLFALAAHAVVVAALALADGRQPGAVWRTVVAMAGLSLLKALLRYGEQFLGHLVAFASLELLRAQIFSALAPRAPRVTVTSRSGDLLARATKDVDRIEVFFAHTFAPAVCAATVPPTVLAVIGGSVSWWAAGAGALTLALAILAVPAAGWGAGLASSRRRAAARAGLTQHVADSVQGLAEVVGYGRSAERMAQTAGLDREVVGAGAPAALAASLRRGGVQLLVLAGPVAVVAAGAGAVRAGTASIAALAAAAAAVLRLSETVRGVEDFTAALGDSLAAAERVHAVVTAPVELPDGGLDLAPAPAHELVWDEVVYTYPGASRPALEGVSLRARAGRWTSLVGASGSGKTTVVQLALRFDDPSGGRVLVDDADVRDLSAESLRGELALVTQRAHMFRATVAQNLRLGAPGAQDAELEAACRVACVHEEVVAMEDGYRTVIGERGATVSGGQRQRLALARALLQRPSVLILDEFTSHLDPALEARVRESVRRWAAVGRGEGRPVTVVEVTHRLHDIAVSDHVVVLDQGRVVQEGGPAELLAVEDGPLCRLLARES